ncbi:hypothetical protein Acr_17g0007600 [Actinidia rufa]|uniref:Uncharacterized protein n=1 Tax=Actinidia rufa TaxID=165716 RepID=A0A7J0G347_9ERIC|nr:hypothetical protein Acr_17g0007600 [Actinidia rufa]
MIELIDTVINPPPKRLRTWMLILMPSIWCKCPGYCGHLNKARQIEPLFIERVIRVKVSSRFKLLSQLRVYEGKTNSMDHLDSYNELDDALRAVFEMEDPSDKVVVMEMMEGLRLGPLFDSLSKNVPKTLSAFQSKADKYIAAEELAEAKRRRRVRDDHKRKEPNTCLGAHGDQNEDFVKWHGKIKTNPLRRKKNKYCEFHKDYGHNTEDCFQLKE